MTDSALPLISVIVAVKNGQKTLSRCLESLAAQTYQPIELILVNDGSTDATCNIATGFASDHPNMSVITTVGVGPSAARNLGIIRSKGEYIAFTDGDCICMPDWLTKLADCLIGAPSVAGVGGDQQSPDDDTAYGKFINGFMKSIGFVADYIKSEDAIVSGFALVKHNPSCNVLYRKDIFEKVGSFTPCLWPGEDVDLDYRITKAGYQLRYTPLAVVKHYRPSNLRSFAKMMYRYGNAQSKLVLMHGMFRFIHIVPIVLFAMFSTTVIMILNGLSDVVSALCLAGVIFAIIYFMSKTKNMVISMRYVFHLLVTVLWWNAGFLSGLKK